MIRSLLLATAIFGAAIGGADAQTRRDRAVSPVTVVAQANADARRRPDPAHFTDATQLYGYAPGAIYEIYGAPGFISTVLLEPGESIVTVAAGDTTRWMVEEAIGGDAASPRAMLLLKPTRSDIRTNIVLVTDRRTYALEAVAVSGQTYSAQTAWTYPQDANAALDGAPLPGENFNFAYHIRMVRGASPRWRPVRVFDDGRKTYIEFSPDIAVSEAPPLFITDTGETALVNYRVSGNRYVVDRLFDIAELRLGAGRPIIVRISRDVPAPPRRVQPRRGGRS
ncbi:MAG: TrbG/VirB9 family P-type conjugative transfer protein [Hyphomonadaceae bacterium]|nr:TrbG/VirB9 family P-type conjugative transfer protein [Hyphomonadaceae bacterium]